VWYRYVNYADKNADVLFMNYGYSDPEDQLKLEATDEKNRYSIQLYRKLADSADIREKNIAEIGCGRGGGLSHIVKDYNPKHAIGIDLDPTAIEFCKANYKLPNIEFKQGDAQKPEIETAWADAVFNVESSHRYPDMKLFVSEVFRILKPGGTFLFTDFRYPHELDQMEKDLISPGFKIVSKTDITQNVVLSLTKDSKRKEELINRLVPFFLRKTAKNFAGVVDSPTFNEFKNRDYIYLFFVLKKE
jgi:SAM-dependent methyltransferase